MRRTLSNDFLPAWMTWEKTRDPLLEVLLERTYCPEWQWELYMDYEHGRYFVQFRTEEWGEHYEGVINGGFFKVVMIEGFYYRYLTLEYDQDDPVRSLQKNMADEHKKYWKVLQRLEDTTRGTKMFVQKLYKLFFAIYDEMMR